MAVVSPERVTDLRKIYMSYVCYCQLVGMWPQQIPSFEQWERDRKRTDAGWKLNYIG